MTETKSPSKDAVSITILLSTSGSQTSSTDARLGFLVLFHIESICPRLLVTNGAPATAARGHDDHTIPDICSDGVLRTQVDDSFWRHCAIGCNCRFVDEEVQAQGAIFATMEAVGRMATTVRQDRGGERSPEFDVADTAVTTPECASATAALTEAELTQKAWVAALEDLRISNAGVRHVHVDAACPVPAGTGPSATCECLIVPVPGCVFAIGVDLAALSEGEVVQAPLAGGAAVKRS